MHLCFNYYSSTSRLYPSGIALQQLKPQQHNRRAFKSKLNSKAEQVSAHTQNVYGNPTKK